MPVAQINDFVASDTTFSSMFNIIRTHRDGARRATYYDYDADEPYNSQYTRIIQIGDTVTAKMIGCLIAPSWTSGGWTADRVENGVYIPLTFPENNNNYDHSDVPVNQWPYVIRWREHLATIADDFVSNPMTDIFALTHRDDGIAPFDAGHTSLESQAFEVSSYVVRTLVGTLWDRIEPIADLNAATDTGWKQKVIDMDALVEKVCASCSGRGWKREFLLKINAYAWGTTFGISAAPNLYFPQKLNGSWVPGDQMPNLTAAELAGSWLQGWNKALDHHHATDGTEAALYVDEPLPAVTA